MRYLLLIIYFFSLHADEQAFDGRSTFSPEGESFPIVDLEGEPTSVIDGCVSVISGDFVDFEQDLMIAGSLPLTLERSYSSSDRSSGLCGGTHLNLGGVVGWLTDGGPKYLGWKGPFGRELHFKKAKDGTFYIDKYMMERGVTNNSSGYISGKTNLKNFTIKQHTPIKYCHTIETGDGSKLLFNNQPDNYADLSIEIKPNGMGYYYDYYPETSFVKNVTVKNRVYKDRQNIHFEYEQLKNKNKDLRITVSSNDFRKVIYTFKLGKYLVNGVKKFRYFVKDVERPDQTNITYSYEKFNHFERAIRKDCGSNFVEVDYYKEGCYGKSKLDEFHPWLDRVHCIKKPLGTTNSAEVAYKFKYHLPKNSEAGVCAVYNAHGIKTDYCWNEEHRITQINRFNKCGHLYTQDLLFWGKDEEESYLKARVYQCNGQTLFSKNYIYDTFGNVTTEKFYGNITGLNTLPIIIDNDGITFENGAERFEKNFLYSQDGKNLLLEECEGNRKKSYVYYSHNNLLACEFTSFHGAIVLRRFFNYDDDCNLIFEISDNGFSLSPEDLSGATLRKVKKITPTNDIPWGLPSIIEEYGIDLIEKKARLEKKTQNFYDLSGKLIRQDIYGSDSEYAFSLCWEYDGKGNLVRETNALGEITHREYDENGNLISELSPGPIPLKKFIYDFSNRLICLSEHHSDIVLSTHYIYNLLSQKIAEIDPYGNTTTFEYDDFGRLVKTVLPPMADGYEQVVSPTIERSYDGFGNLISKKDENGNVTIAQYTARGQPSKIWYPDGTTEQFVYFFHGPIMAKRERNGSSTCYTRDYKDRIVKTEFFAPDGSLMWAKSAIYDAFNLLEETEATGIKTFYAYDGFGRKIKMARESFQETYEYDVLGRLISTSTYYEDGQAIIKKTSYDFLNRVIEEREENSEGDLTALATYAYDSQGNRIRTITYGEDKTPQISECYYNSHGIIAESIDPYGEVTRSRFFVECNQLGQLVPGIETIDRLGNLTRIVKDGYGREAICEKKNPFGTTVQKQEFFHDPVGNLCKTVESVIVDEKSINQVITFWTFDTMNRVTSLTEALSSNDQKTTIFAYNSEGQLATITKPSGQAIHHTYQADGLLASYSSPHFHYIYEYDLDQRLISSYDLLSQEGFKKTYNSSGHLVEEIQGDFPIKYTPDNIGRTKVLELPDASKVSYTYQGSQLKRISRLSNDSEDYSYTYDCYDLCGKAIQETMIEQRGKITRNFDLKGRLARAKSNFHEERNSFDSEDNLLKKEFLGSIENAENTYSYDSLHQLTSEEGAVSHQYSFDSLYNRLSKDDAKYTINSLNQILQVGNEHYTYDDDGSLLQSPMGTFTYDALGRLLSSTKDGISTKYAYDSLNRRISKTTGSQTTYFIYDGLNEIGAIQNNQLIEFRVLGLGLGAEIGAAISIELRGMVYAPLHDLSGNVIALINSDNEIAESYSYSAFGEEKSQSYKNPWRFCSKRVDEETGLVYFGHRYYNSSLGRWMSQDPLGHEAGPNLYAYVCNSPLVHFDAFGLFQQKTSRLDYYDHYDDQYCDKEFSQWCVYPLSDRSYYDIGTGFINGVWNTIGNLLENANYLVNLGVANLSIVYNPTHGFFGDIDECMLGLSGIATPPVRNLHKQWDQFFANTSSESHFLQICHSQGAIHVRNALVDYPEDLRKRITVVAIAPAAYMDPNTCHSAFHYRAPAYRDFIPRISRTAAEAKGTIYDLPSAPGASFFDHCFNSPTYHEILTKHIKLHNNKGKKL